MKTLNALAAPAESFHRHGIQHLVGQQHTVEIAPGQPVEPVDAIEEPRHHAAQRIPLPAAQFTAALENEVASRQAVANQFAGSTTGRVFGLPSTVTVK